MNDEIAISPEERAKQELDRLYPGKSQEEITQILRRQMEANAKTPIAAMLRPESKERNLHHTLEYRSQEDWDNENLPRGKGDVDYYGDPNEPEDIYPENLPKQVKAGKQYIAHIPLNQRPF